MDQLALWSLLRSFDNGSGNLVINTRSQLVTLLKDFGYSPDTTKRLLRKADGRFLQLHEGIRRAVIKIYGLYTVCRSYNITLDGDKHARLIPAEDFNTLNKRRSQLYASIFKPHGVTANPITRETITKLTGLNKAQQIRYEKAAGMKRTPNFEVQEVKGQYIPVTTEVYSKSRVSVVPRRLGNTYHTHQEVGNKGMTRRVHKALTHVKESFMPDEALKVRKCFFTSMSRALRYFKGFQNETDKTAYYMVRNAKRVIKGRLEWCFHQQGDTTPLLNYGGIK